MKSKVISFAVSDQNRHLLLSLAILILMLGSGLTWLIKGWASPSTPQSDSRVTAPTRPGSGTSVADGSVPTRQESAIRQFSVLAGKAAEMGMVRVIVGIRGEDDEQADPMRPRLTAAEPEAIEQAQSQLLSQLAGYDPASVKRFRYIPFLALKVSPEGLESLRRSAQVASVQEDTALLSATGRSLGASIGVATDEKTSDYPTGMGQSVVVIDAGVDQTQPYLAGKVVAEACFSTNDPAAGVSSLCPAGVSASSDDNSSLPCPIDVAGCEQGTNVAGVVAGRSPGFEGIAPGAAIVAMQVFSRFDGTGQCADGGESCIAAFDSDLISALERAFELRGDHAIAAVTINLAGGKFTSSCDESFPATKAAIDLLQGAGIATVVASGSGGFANALSAPACISSAISVGATTKLEHSVEQVDPTTNSSPNLQFLAPGEAIPESVFVGRARVDAPTARVGKSSMAAPQVAGFFALAREKRPGIGIGTVVNVLKTTGEAIVDQRNGVTIPRVRIDSAIASLDKVAAAPLAPTGLFAITVSATQINLTWDDVENETSYDILRTTSINSTTGTVVGSVSANQTSFENNGLIPGRTYYYFVVAKNGDGSSGLSDRVRATTQPVPLPASNLTAVDVTSSQIDLTWTDNSTNEQGYSIRRSLTNGGPYAEVATVGPNVTKYANGNLVSGTVYYYVVVATNGGAESAASNQATATTPEVAPVAPTGLAVSVVSPSIRTELNLEWIDNSNNESSFRIERRSGQDPFTAIGTVTSNTQTYRSTGLVKNTQYFYRVYAVNGKGDSPQSNIASGVTPDDPPAPPAQLTATVASASQINLAWNDSSNNETGFRIFRRLSSSGSYPDQPIATLPSNTATYQDSGLNDDTTYFYRVVAANSGGDSTGVEASATTLPLPDPPSGLVATTKTANSLSLSWVDNSSSPKGETGFRIKRSTNTGGPYTAVKTVGANVTSTDDVGLEPETVYYYVVVAINSNGESEASSEGSATTAPLPAAPTGVVATPNSSSQITLTWSENVSDDQGFEVSRRSGTGAFTVLGTTPVGATSYVDNERISGRQTYVYQVRTINSNGLSLPALSNEVTTPAGAPAAPSNLTAVPSSGSSVNLTWIDNSATETEFRIERSQTSGTGFTPIGTALPANTTSYVDTGLTSGTTYFYRAFAYREATSGDPAYTSVSSNEASATPPPIPNPPGGLVVTADSGTLVTLSWNDTSSNETGFRISRKTLDGTFTQVGTTLANVTSFSDTTAGDGTAYVYSLVAFNVAGDSAAIEGGVTTPLAAPGSPTAAPINATTIRLTWVDKTTNETSFRVERRQSGSGNFQAIDSTLPSNSTRYDDNSSALIVGVNYDYRVIALNATISSPTSETAMAKLQPLPAQATGLSASPTSTTTARLNWTDASTNESGFRISRKTGSTGTYASQATVDANVTTFTDSGLTEGTQYFYQVTAFNISGDSASPLERSVTTRSNAPTGLTATVLSSTSVRLNWNDNSATEVGFSLRRRIGSESFVEVAQLPANVTTFTDLGLIANSTYLYRVFAINGGGLSGPSEDISVTPPALPGKVENLVATPNQANTTSRVVLTWNDTANETGFKIQRSLTNAGPWTTVRTNVADLTAWDDTDVSDDITYYYRVTAFNFGGDGPDSDVASAKTPLTAPAAPSELVATRRSQSQITLSWKDNSNRENGYRIERKTESGTYTSLTPIQPANTVIYNDTGLTADTAYTYRVVAVNEAGTTESNEATASTGPTPAAPNNLRLSVRSASQIDLAWNDNSLSEIGYRIRRRPDQVSNEVVIGIVPSNGTTTAAYSDINLKSGTTYFYTVTAYDENGESLPTTSVSARTPDAFPTPPSGVTATAISSNQVNVSWIDNSDNETSFVVQRKTGEGGFVDVSVGLPANTTSYNDTVGIQPETTYTYRLIVTNILTTGGISPIYSVNEATVTTPMAAPAAPTGFKATIVSSFQLNLAWTDLAVNESGYRLYRKIGSGEYELYQILPPGSVFFQDVGLEEGETYGYRLAAFNTIGESAPFAELTQTMPVVPGSPILVVNKKSSTSLELVWTEAGGVETGFRIFRRTGTSGNFSQIATVGANVLTFVNTGLTVSTTYQYYVTAFNEGGESDPGTPVSQTTPTIPPAPTLGTLTANSYNVVTINWTYPDSVQDLISFLIQRSGSASGPFTQVTELANPAQTSYQDTGLNSNRTYHYRVIAKTAFEQSPASAVAAVKTLDGPPEIPSNLVAKVTNGTTITLTWIDNSSNETHFKVRRSPAGTDTWTEFEPNLTVSTYVDTTPVAGQRYDYQVKAVNSLATPPDLGWTASTNAGIPASFPANPTALVASTRTPTSVSLTWELNPVSVNPETSIVLQRKLTTASENPETVATIPSAAIGSYTINDLTEGTSYTFTVLAQNILGSSSQPATLVASTRPLAPSSLLATVDTFNSANLTWVDNSTRETGYRIYQKLVDNETYSRVEANIGPNVTTFKVTGLTSGVAYNFKVVAIKDSDESPDSEEVSLALPTQPNAPTALIAVTNQSSQATRVSQIDLAWADNSSGESGFRIERRTGFSATYELVTTVGPNVKQYSNIGLTSGTSFTYRVAAFNIGGLSNWSNEATAETEGFPPNAPSDLTATPVSGSQINLSWVDNADNELGFRVQRRQIPTNGSPGSWLTIATLNANVKSYPSTNLISGRRYAFRVTAFNNDGDATSNEAFADTLLAVPAAPTELTATAVSGLQINLAWIDNSGSEDGFRIMRKASLSGTFAELKTVPPDSRTYQDTGLTPNTRYYYQVMAYNGVGNSAPTNEASATTLVAPNAPTNLVVTVVSSTQIDLSWTDNSTNETGFRIQRRSGTVQTWIEVATVAANIRTYQNTGLSPGQTYIYRVVAYTSTSDSAPTNEASGTTPIGVPAAPSNLQAIPISTSQINLGWSDNSNNETGFTIRRKAGLSGTYTDVGTVAANTTTFQSSGLASAVTYYFVVVATNSNGNSGPSNEAFATTISGGTQVPAAPTGLTATAASSTQINLTWSDNSTNETGFRIQRRTGIDGTWSDIATTASDVTSYSDSSLTPATTYYYTVRATNAVGDSVLSNEATATTTDGSTTPLAPPADLTVTAMTVTSTRLNWRDTSTSEAGFRVQRRLGTAGAWVDAATLGANTVSYEDTGLQSNSSLAYRVIAFNETSNSDPSNEQSIVMPSFDFQPLSNDLPVTGVVSRNQSKYFRIYVPSGATELTVQTTGNNNVHLYVRFERQPNITANCRSEGPTSTELCRLPAPNPGDWHIQILGAGTTTSSNFTLTASYKGSGVAIPAAPTQLVATPVSSSQVNLTWSDNSANETGFRVRRRLATSTTWTLIHTTATPNAISYQDSSLSPGTTYVYYVTAINVAGESSSSNESSATTLSAGGTVPAAPSSLVATSVSSSQIRLTWTDNSNNETGFRVRRRTGSTGSFSDVATVAPNTATFLNTGLAANTTYFYQVIAINDFGNSSGSNESSATTSTSGGGGEIPESPTDLRVSAVSVSSVSLSWTDNSPNESGFRVERRLASGEWVLATSLGINVRTWQDVGLISGATFTYRVTAFNASGSSAPSTEKAVTIPSFNFTILTNKVGVTSSVSRSASKYFMISVPDGMAELIVETTGTFDPNLYIRHERQPTEIAYSCRSISIGPVERCRILAPQSGDWHIQIVGNSVTTSNFTVTATINEPQL